MMATPANVLSVSSGMASKVNKSTPQSRKGNSLRLSLRRFSHHGGTASSNKAARTDSGIFDPSSSTLELEIFSWSRCQQAILRLAQGQKVDADDRVKILVSVRNLAFGSKNLANVLLNELFAPSLVQSSFKQLAASFDKCSTANSIAALWGQFYTIVLPDLHAVLYPFEEASVTDIRKMILIAFRDAVVLDHELCYGLLEKGCGGNAHPNIQRMLLILEQNTRDGTANYGRLQSLCEDSVDDFSSLEISSYPPPSTSSPLFFIEEQEIPREQSASPKPLQRLLRRAKGSFSALTSGEQADLVMGGYLDVTHRKEGRSRSPLARMKNALLADNVELPRRHSYAPGTS